MGTIGSAIAACLNSPVMLAAPPWANPSLFGEQIVAGLATGGIYALVALAIVLIYRSTNVINFAQGEMAMFATFITWSIAAPTAFDRMPLWLVYVVGVLIAGMMGAVIERVIIRPVENAPVLSVVVVTLGLFVVFNSLATSTWGGEPKPFPTPLSITEGLNLGFARLSWHRVGILVTAFGVMGALFLLFNYTKVGLAMRATTLNPLAARLMGINVGRMLTMGWALSGAVGGLAGLLIAPITTIHPSFMLAVLLFAFAAAVLGGLTSPPGAVVGGFLIGVTENPLGTYTPEQWLGPEMKLPLTLLLLVLVLLIRPTGLFGRPAVRRV